jgi:hypothetical protein
VLGALNEWQRQATQKLTSFPFARSGVPPKPFACAIGYDTFVGGFCFKNIKTKGGHHALGTPSGERLYMGAGTLAAQPLESVACKNDAYAKALRTHERMNKSI